MKLCNFRIANDNIAFEQAGCYFDLHNCFDFKGFSYDVSLKAIKLRWTKNSGDWVPADSPVSLELTICGIYLFKARERNAEIPFTEDDCLSNIGFLWDELTDEMEGFYSNEPEEKCTHLTIQFESGLSLKIGGEEATLNAIGT